MYLVEGYKQVKNGNYIMWDYLDKKKLRFKSFVVAKKRLKKNYKLNLKNFFTNVKIFLKQLMFFYVKKRFLKLDLKTRTKSWSVFYWANASFFFTSSAGMNLKILNFFFEAKKLLKNQKAFLNKAFRFVSLVNNKLPPSNYFLADFKGRESFKWFEKLKKSWYWPIDWRRRYKTVFLGPDKKPSFRKVRLKKWRWKIVTKKKYQKSKSFLFKAYRFHGEDRRFNPFHAPASRKKKFNFEGLKLFLYSWKTWLLRSRYRLYKNFLKTLKGQYNKRLSTKKRFFLFFSCLGKKKSRVLLKSFSFFRYFTSKKKYTSLKSKFRLPTIPLSISEFNKAMSFLGKKKKFWALKRTWKVFNLKLVGSPIRRVRIFSAIKRSFSSKKKNNFWVLIKKKINFLNNKQTRNKKKLITNAITSSFKKK